MKKIFCFMLSIMLVIISVPITAFAKQEATFKRIPVEYSDNRSQTEYLDLMVKENRVYVNAEQLADRFGYEVVTGDESVLIKCLETPVMPRTFVVFNYTDTKVTKMLYSCFCDKFEAPFASEKNENGVWIPFEYSVLVLNSGITVLDNCILIDIPEKTILDCFYDAQRNASLFYFDWAKDFSWDESNVNILGVSSQWVNMLNGVLAFDYLSWVQLLQTTNSLGTLTNAYDAKYGERIATLICTQSDEEIKAEVNKIDVINDIFSEDGHLGNALVDYSKELDESTGSLYNSCNTLLEKMKSGNSSTVQYNKSYREFEKAMDKQTWFSNTGEKIIGVQKGLSRGTTVLKAISYIADYLNCINEFKEQDDFAVSSLKAEIGQNPLDGNLLLHNMKSSMKLYANQLSTDVGIYSAVQFIKNNLTKIIDDGAKITAALGSKVNLMLFAWNLASNFVPFISEGLEVADKFELALYSQVFQADAGNYYRYLRDSVFINNYNPTSEDLYKVSQYCYVYFKSCYVTRNAALGAILPANKEKMSSKIDAQNTINNEIAEIMATLKSANEDNKDNVYGFLPADNKKYLETYSDSILVSFLESNGSSSSSQNTPAANLTKTYHNTQYGWSVDIPTEWNQYGSIKESDNGYSFSVIFYHKELNEKYSNGYVLSIEAISKSKGNQQPPGLSGYLGENNDYYFYWIKASDVQWMASGHYTEKDMDSEDQRHWDEYKVLEKAADKIINSFKLDSPVSNGEYSSQASSNSTQNDSWKSLYIDYINENTPSYVEPECALIELDDNDVPELIFYNPGIHIGGMKLVWIVGDEIREENTSIRQYKEKEAEFWGMHTGQGVYYGSYEFRDGKIITINTASNGMGGIIVDGKEVDEPTFNSMIESIKLKGNKEPTYMKKADIITAINNYSS